MKSSAVVFTLLLLLSACGGESPETATSQTPPAAAQPAEVVPAVQSASGPCVGLTDADISEVMGHGMKPSEATNPTECVFVSATGDATKSVAFQILPGEDTFKQMSANGEPLTGIGDRAAVVGPTVVAATKGGRTFIGGIYDGADQAGQKQKSIELARKVVAKM